MFEGFKERRRVKELLKSKLAKEEYLAVIKNDKNPEMRGVAIQKIKDSLSQAEYYSLFLSGYSDTREFALERITDSGILMNIVQSAGNELRTSADETRRESAAALLLAIYRKHKEPQIHGEIQTYSGSVIHRNDHTDENSHADEETAYNGWFCDHSDFADHTDQGREETCFMP